MKLTDRISKVFTTLLGSKRDLPPEELATVTDERLKKPLVFSDLSHVVQIEGTQIFEGTHPRGGITAYDTRSGRFLFGEPNSDLWYIGKLWGKHIARKQDKVDENRWVNYLVDEDGRLLFGRKFSTSGLTLIDSKSEEAIEINIYDDCPESLRDRLKGNENTLIEFAGDTDLSARIKLYSINGVSLDKGDIATFAEEEVKGGSFDSEKVYELKAATKIDFVTVDGAKFVEVTYNKTSQIFELNK